MSVNTDELKKFLENKIASLRKELEFYEFLLSIIESGYLPTIKGNKGSIEYIKNKRGEILAEIYFTPPVAKFVIKNKITLTKSYFSALSKILESEKELNKIDYTIEMDKNDLREIILKNINSEIIYNKIKTGIQAILERATG
ncbi:conserved hypothetical protein [Sulfolobus islandicus Y.G.57.14]|jgi:hypothetical protein|uniref:Uncharacterized protein n=10 Tax=Saccharolobus islandicus TaxID=43080 RepID=M9U8D8_SACIS|nr:hypothetical protein [Sulfolobus islandicus]ACP36138.1 conserved hypothetical protein [Sulfolobus islandicus L.S.2.15]ACP38727.1 conserved hypothetical protein [Sulfolobus islandicus M.14.25]ACP46360.1 conserved hypothetical protein [Sulfolobus islandicus Y.G.57.14]ACP47935.1 conserved hypothetical protein [Sulfolobus islandicus Y.N.15.51]ACP55930.1 conserved hypothetical protein [Sulfolobus islandicus M.16.27]